MADRANIGDARAGGTGLRWTAIVGTLAGLFLGGVFLYAVWGKALDISAFAESIQLEGLGFWLSADVLAYLVIALEAAIGMALLLDMRRLWVLIPTAALALFFTYLNGKVYVDWLNGVAPATASCGCFGHLLDRNPEEAFWQDTLLMVPPLLLAFLGRPRGPFPRRRFVVGAVTALAAAVFAWKAPDLPLDDVATRLKPGAQVAEVCVGSGKDRTCLAGP